MRASVILGFKDWGLERLRLCIEHAHASLAHVDHEVVVCDFGSTDPDSVREATESADGRVTRVESGTLWSRSQALNAAAAESAGEIILATDADMLFTPSALTRVVEVLEGNANQIVILQCRDLPVGMDDRVVVQEGIDFERFFALSTVRPRWGMGGLVGVKRDHWERLRGWEERMHTYGGEDIDFGRRGQRFGLRTNWLDEPTVGMFHMWHPSTSKAASRSAEATKAIEYNRSLHTSDSTIIRNRTGDNFLPDPITPIVSVIMLANGSDESYTAVSVLQQTVSSIELLVPEQLSFLTEVDPRVRTGGVNEARGTFIMTAIQGDWWNEKRIESLLAETDSITGLVSDWTNRRLRSEKNDDLTEVIHSVGDASSMLARADLVKTGTDRDPSAAMVRAIVSGSTWKINSAAGREIVVDLADDERLSELQRLNEKFVQQLLDSTMKELPAQPATPTAPVKSWLHRQCEENWFALTVTLSPSATHRLQEFVENASWECELASIEDADGNTLKQVAILRGSGQSDYLRLVSLVREVGGELTPGATGRELFERFSLVNYAERMFGHERPGFWLVVDPVPDESQEVLETLRGAPGVLAALRRSINMDGTVRQLVLARTPSLVIADALEIANYIGRFNCEAEIVKAIEGGSL